MIQHLGRYQILRELGRGGMGVVYKALDPHLERHVAIKCLSEELSRDELVVARFLREARNVAALTHPNCVRLYVVDEHEGMPYFVMEYVDGQSLADYLARHGRCAPDMARRIVRECAEALAAADAKNIVHRDVKPGNVMLDSSGRALLADFGIACVQYGSGSASATVMGTPGYMPPELIEQGLADRRADIFALGAVYYEMLTGQRLLPGDSLKAARAAMRRPDFPDLSAIEREHGAATAALLARMLAPDPAARHADYDELLRALDPEHAELAQRKAETAPTQQVNTVESGPEDADLAPTLAATEPAAALGTEAATRSMPPPGMARYRRVGLAALVIVGVTLIGLAIALTGGNDAAAPELAADDPPPAAIQAPAEPEAAVEIVAGKDTAKPGAALADAPASDSPAALVPIADEFAHDPDGHPADDAIEPRAAGFVFDTVAPSSTTGDETDDPSTETAPDPAALAGGPAATTVDDTPSDPYPASGHAIEPTSSAAVSPDAQAADTRLAMLDARPTAPPAAVAEARPARAPSASEPAAAAPTPRRIAVVGVGDPTIADVMAGEVEAALRRDGRAVADRRFIAGFDRYLYEDGLDLAGLAGPAREAGVRYVVMLRARPAGSRELVYYGRYDTAWSVQVDAVTYDLLQRDQIGASEVAQFEYTGINASQKARDAVAPWLQPISRQFTR